MAAAVPDQPICSLLRLKAVLVRSLGIVCVVGVCHALVAVSKQQATDTFAIRDVRLFDGERVLDHRNVIVEAGRIKQVTDSATEIDETTVVDGRGRTLIPGLFDSHVHAINDASLRQAVAFGVTTMLDMFNGGERLEWLKGVARDDPADRADVRTAGVGATAPGGHPTQMGGPPFPTIARPSEAQAFIDARIAEGSDYIKITYDDLRGLFPARPLPMLDKGTLAALVKAAHARGKLTVAHIMSEQQAREAIEAGVDGLAHMFIASSVSPDFGAFVARHRAFVIPTLSVLETACGNPTGPGLAADERLAPFLRSEWVGRLKAPWPFPLASCKGTEEAMRQLARADVAILAGTDAPAPGSTYGASVHGELALMVRVGMTPVQALAAATSIPARTFRLSDRGYVRPRLRADIVLLDGDPTSDILATRRIAAVWKRGVPVQREPSR